MQTVFSNQNWFLIKTCIRPFISTVCPSMSKHWVQLKPATLCKRWECKNHAVNFLPLIDRQKIAFSWSWNAHGWLKNNRRDKHSWIPILTAVKKKKRNKTLKVYTKITFHLKTTVPPKLTDHFEWQTTLYLCRKSLFISHHSLVICKRWRISFKWNPNALANTKSQISEN